MLATHWLPQGMLAASAAILFGVSQVSAPPTVRPTSQPTDVSRPKLPELPELRQRYEAAERESLHLSQEFAGLSDDANDRARRDEITQQLRHSVNTAFDLRQQWQEKEVAQLRERLQAIERRIATRREQREQIVNRRIEDLLHPEQTWDSPLPAPQGDVLTVAPFPSVTVFNPPPVPIQLPAKPNVNRQVFRYERSYGQEDRSVPPEQFQINLRLFQVNREIAQKLELPLNNPLGGIAATKKQSGEEFNALLRQFMSSNDLQILADPTLVTTLGRRAKMQTESFADGKRCRLSLAVSPEQWKNGRLKMLVDADITFETAADAATTSRDADDSPSNEATGSEQTRAEPKADAGRGVPAPRFQQSAQATIQTNVEITPENLAVFGPWPSDSSDRLVYLLVQQQPIHAHPPSQRVPWVPVPPAHPSGPIPPGSNQPGPSQTAPHPGPTSHTTGVDVPVVPDNAVAPSSRPQPLLAEPWPQKLPSDYAAQRQEILANVSEAAEMAARSVNDEVMRTRGRLLAARAQEQLRVLAEEYDGNMMLHQVRCEQQQAALQIVQRQFAQVSERHKAGLASGAEFAQAQAAFRQAEDSHTRAKHLLDLYRSNRDAITNQDEPQMILREFQRAADAQREETEKQKQESEVREEAPPYEETTP